MSLFKKAYAQAGQWPRKILIDKKDPYVEALAHYPPSDRYHLNETYNNLGSVYFDQGYYAEAKAIWEKALVLLPADEVVRGNLIKNIYENPNVPEDLRAIAPFIRQHLYRYES